MKIIEGSGPWWAWWREQVVTGPGPYSPLHRTTDHTTTLCGEALRRTTGKGEPAHLGVRVTKREPRVHALKVCSRCKRKASAKRYYSGQKAA